MRTTFALPLLVIGVLCSTAALPPPAQAEELWINMVAATSTEEAPPMGLFAAKPWAIAGMFFKSGKWQAEKGSTYSKLHLYADREFTFGGVEIKTCGQKLEDDVTVFVNFDEQVYKLEAARFGSALRYVTEGQDKPKARSVTLNFGKTHDVCVTAVTLLDGNHDAYGVRVPRIVSGKAVASSTTKPVEAYDVMNLFDSRYESGWASNAKSIGEKLDFTFDEPQTITMLKVWNGYQRSDQHCFENMRVKVLDVEGDGGYKATVQVQDVMGSQDLPLPKPFTGKHLRLVVKEAYKGKTYQDLVITELRFFDSKEWFTLDPFPRIREIAAKNHETFAKAGLERAVNGELAGELINETAEWSNGALFRFRSDGSFYFEGKEDAGFNGGTRRRVQALGNYEVRKVSASDIEMRVFGLFAYKKFEQAESNDCNGCGRDCNKAVSESGGLAGEESRQQIFQEVLQFTRQAAPDGAPIVTVKSLGKKHFLIPQKELDDQEKTLELKVVH